MLASGGLFLCRPSQPLACGQGISLFSDLHLGSPQLDETLLKRELQDAASRKDRLLFNGDIFDAILTSDSKRFRPGAVHPRLQGCDDILGLTLNWAEELLAPYAHLIDMIGLGNHDDAVVKHHSSCPVSQLIKRLQRHVGSKHTIHFGGYTGFVRYRLARSEKAKRYHRAGDSLTLFFWHGTGGGSSIGSSLSELGSKGTFVEGADVHWFAHRHVRLAAPIERISCSGSGVNPLSRQVWYVRTAAYLRSYAGQSQLAWQKRGRQSNYGADALHSPYGRGGVRLVVTDDATSKVRVELN